jgi:hypothetical protein
MKLIIFALLLGIGFETVGQRIISGKVIFSEFRDKKSKNSYEFWTFPGAKIFYNDSLSLGTTEEDGEFRLELPEGTHEIVVRAVGMYPDKIRITGNCEYLEVILLPDAIYDFVTIQKEEKLRRKDRAILPELYRKAFEQGLFRQAEPCR